MIRHLKLLRQYLRVQQELKRYNDAPPVATKPLPKIISNHKRGVVWQIPVPDQSDVFMCLPIYAGERYFVVYVSGIDFYRAWLATGIGDSQSCRLKRDMPNDYKFHHAVSGFSHGYDNPVPIADVAPSMYGGKLRIWFTDGITRTFWLLANDVPNFPVMCNGWEAAKLLSDSIGYTDPICISSLFEKVVEKPNLKIDQKVRN